MQWDIAKLLYLGTDQFAQHCKCIFSVIMVPINIKLVWRNCRCVYLEVVGHRVKMANINRHRIKPLYSSESYPPLSDDPWHWPLTLSLCPQGSLSEGHTIQQKVKSEFLHFYSECFIFQELNDWKHISVMFVSGSFMHDLLYESLFHPLLIHLTAFPTLSPPAHAQLCFQLFPHFLSQHSLILSSITSFSFFDLSGILGQIAWLLYSYASVLMLPCFIKTAKHWMRGASGFSLTKFVTQRTSQNLRMVILPSEKSVSHWEHVGLALLRLKWFVMVIRVERPHEDLHYRSFVCKIKGVKSAPYVRYMLWTWSCLAYDRSFAYGEQV